MCNYVNEWEKLELLIKKNSSQEIDNNIKTKIVKYFDNTDNKNILLNIFQENDYKPFIEKIKKEINEIEDNDEKKEEKNNIINDEEDENKVNFNNNHHNNFSNKNIFSVFGEKKPRNPVISSDEEKDNKVILSEDEEEINTSVKKHHLRRKINSESSSESEENDNKKHTHKNNDNNNNNFSFDIDSISSNDEKIKNKRKTTKFSGFSEKKPRFNFVEKEKKNLNKKRKRTNYISSDSENIDDDNYSISNKKKDEHNKNNDQEIETNNKILNFDEATFNEFTFILLTNLEAKKLNIELDKDKIILPLNDNEKFSDEEFILKIKDNIASFLNCKNEDSLINIYNWLIYLLNVNGNDQIVMQNELLSISGGTRIIPEQKSQKIFITKKRYNFKKN